MLVGHISSLIESTSPRLWAWLWKMCLPGRDEAAYHIPSE